MKSIQSLPKFSSNLNSMKAWWFFEISLMNLKENGIEMDDELLWIDVVGGDGWNKLSVFFLFFLFGGDGEERKKKSLTFKKTIYMYLGFVPIWCSHCNIGELTSILKIFYSSTNPSTTLKTLIMCFKSFNVKKTVSGKFRDPEIHQKLESRNPWDQRPKSF